MKPDRSITAAEAAALYTEAMPAASDCEFVFNELMDSIRFCEALGCTAWSLSQLEHGFRLNVGPVEALTCFFAIDGNKTEVRMRKLLAGADRVQKARDPRATIEAGEYKSVREPHWIYSSFFHAATTPETDTDRAAIAKDFGDLRANHEAFLRLACTTAKGEVVRGTPFARNHSNGLTEYARAAAQGAVGAAPASMSISKHPRFLFEVGRGYERKEVIAAVGIHPVPTGGDWFTGYTTYDGVSFIFCNIGSAGRTGHDYQNYWDGDELEWSGKTGSRASWDSIKALTDPGAEVHLFYRNADREPFTYAGLAVPVFVDEEVIPVKIRWRFEEVGGSAGDGPSTSVVQTEGAKKVRFVTTYERSGKARSDCLKHYGAMCCVCKIDFSVKYGDIGKGFMHVHHLKPVADGEGKEATVDPIQDLRPVCPNCHSMLHRRKPPLSVEQLLAVISP